MYRQALLGQSQYPPQFYTGNSQAVLDGTGLSDDDSFEGENPEINGVFVFRCRLDRYFVALSPGETRLWNRRVLW